MSTTRPITKVQAQPLIHEYKTQGKASHFDYEGTRIKGYIFNRTEIYNLISSTTDRFLFLMWCLSKDSTGKKHYLNLIVSGATSSAIDIKAMRISGLPPYTALVQLDDQYLIEGPKGGPMTMADLTDMKKKFINDGATSHLYPPSSTSIHDKVKGYELTRTDLTDLGLLTAPNTQNKNDEFIFVPIIRTKQLTAPPFTNHYLSIAVARFENNRITGHIREYCDPCPSACLDYNEHF